MENAMNDSQNMSTQEFENVLRIVVLCSEDADMTRISTLQVAIMDALPGVPVTVWNMGDREVCEFIDDTMPIFVLMIGNAQRHPRFLQWANDVLQPLAIDARLCRNPGTVIITNHLGVTCRQ